MLTSNDVGVFVDGRCIGAAHWYRGRLGGYAVRGSARYVELGDRARQAMEVENDRRVRVPAQLASMLRERVRYGTIRRAEGATYPLGDDYQPVRETRAAGITY
jgi:hypothetical protein